MKSKKLIVYEYNQSNVNSMHQIKEIATSIQNLETLEFILNGEFDKISKYDKDVIENNIGGYNYIQSSEELKANLINIKKIYDLYSKINNETYTLAWNRTQARFYIIEKGASPKRITFYEFLKDSKNYWWAAC